MKEQGRATKNKHAVMEKKNKTNKTNLTTQQKVIKSKTVKGLNPLHKKGRIIMIVWVSVILNRTVVDKLCSCYLQTK